jgi:YidC/Oxa1 family membrane protein insertase
MENMNEVIPKQTGYFNFNWNQTMQVAEHEIDAERTNSTVYFKEDEVDYLSETNEEDKAEIKRATWLSYKQQFFNSTIINKAGFDEGKTSIKYEKADTSYLKKCESKLVMRFDNATSASYPMQWYAGPNNYKELKSYNIELQSLLPLGWGVFGWCNKYFILPLFVFLQKFISSYGLIILMLTIIIKLITFPLTYKSYVASAKMKLLKPEIDKLKIKYKDDPQALQMEQMKVQSKSGVNPLGGCLPQLVQMPIWIALYRFFPASIEFRQQPFLWATDLSNFDSIFNLGGFHISLFCVLFCVSQLLMTWYMSKTTDIPDQMKYMQYFFPVMMFFFLNSTSAGLNWYLFAGNIITFILQYVSLNYIIDNNKLKLEMEEKKKKPAKKSLFQQKMEEAMKQRQQNTKK